MYLKAMPCSNRATEDSEFKFLTKPQYKKDCLV